MNNYFTSPTTLKANYPIDDSLEDKYLIPVIRKAQDFIIANLFCVDYWKQLCEKLDLEINGTDAFTENEKYLVNTFFEPMIAYYVMSEVVYNTTYKTVNAGMEDDVEIENVQMLSNKYLNDSKAPN